MVEEALQNAGHSAIPDGEYLVASVPEKEYADVRLFARVHALPSAIPPREDGKIPR